MHRKGKNVHVKKLGKLADMAEGTNSMACIFAPNYAGNPLIQSEFVFENLFFYVLCEALAPARATV